MSATLTGSEATLNAVFGDEHSTALPNTWYVALFLDDPGESGTGTEVSGAGYTRAEVANDDGNWEVTGFESKANAAQITFTEATGGWGEVTHWALFDDPSAGVAYFYGELSVPTEVFTGDIPFIGINDLTVTVD